jgi:hypothetical protein
MAKNSTPSYLAIDQSYAAAWDSYDTSSRPEQSCTATNWLFVTFPTCSHTGRQPSLLYSVLYGIISKRRCILPRNLSLEKKQVARELALLAISLTCLLKFIWWKLK